MYNALCSQLGLAGTQPSSVGPRGGNTLPPAPPYKRHQVDTQLDGVEDYVRYSLITLHRRDNQKPWHLRCSLGLRLGISLLLPLSCSENLGSCRYRSGPSRF